MIRTIKSSILAGGCVGIAGFGYLADKSIIGAVPSDRYAAASWPSAAASS